MHWRGGSPDLWNLRCLLDTMRSCGLAGGQSPVQGRGWMETEDGGTHAELLLKANRCVHPDSRAARARGLRCPSARGRSGGRLSGAWGPGRGGAGRALQGGRVPVSGDADRTDLGSRNSGTLWAALMGANAGRSGVTVWLAGIRRE